MSAESWRSGTADGRMRSGERVARLTTAFAFLILTLLTTSCSRTDGLDQFAASICDYFDYWYIAEDADPYDKRQALAHNLKLQSYEERFCPERPRV